MVEPNPTPPQSDEQLDELIEILGDICRKQYTGCNKVASDYEYEYSYTAEVVNTLAAPEARAALLAWKYAGEIEARVDELKLLHSYLKKYHLYDQDAAMKLRWHFGERLAALQSQNKRKEGDA